MIFVAPDLDRLGREIGRAFHPYYLFSPPHATCYRIDYKIDSMLIHNPGRCHNNHRIRYLLRQRKHCKNCRTFRRHSHRQDHRSRCTCREERSRNLPVSCSSTCNRLARWRTYRYRSSRRNRRHHTVCTPGCSYPRTHNQVCCSAGNFPSSWCNILDIHPCREIEIARVWNEWVTVMGKVKKWLEW